jgi:hypothetical protein
VIRASFTQKAVSTYEPMFRRYAAELLDPTQQSSTGDMAPASPSGYLSW